MKIIKRFAIAFLACLPVFGVGSVVQSIGPLGPPPVSGPDTRTYVLNLLWTGDSVTGSVPATVISLTQFPQLQGMRVISFEVQPGTPAPTNGYALSLIDSTGIDMLGGAAINLSSSASSSNSTVLSPPLVAPPTFNVIGNSVASARGAVNIYLAQQTQITATQGAAALAGANTFTGVNTFSGDTRLSNVGTFNVQEWVGTTQYPTLASAIAAAAAGTTIHIPAGVFQISATQNITQAGIKILGDGIDTSFIQITSATANYFSIQASEFELGNLTLSSSLTRTGGFVVVNGSAGGFTDFYAHDLKLTDTYGGFQIIASTGTVAGLRFRNIIHRTTAALHSGSLFVLGGGTSPVADVGMEGIYTPVDAATYDAPQIIFDTLLDTVHMWDYDVGFSVGIAQTQNVVKFQNTSAGIVPKFIHIVHMSIEGGGSTASSDCMNIAVGADIDIADSYIANCGNEAINISGGASINGPIRIHHNWIGNNQKGGLYVSSAASSISGLQFDGNSFNNNSINANNTFDDIQVAAGTIGLSITNNHFGAEVFHSANKSRYGINLIAGATNTILVRGNDCDSTNLGTACILNGATGANQIVDFPNMFSTMTATAGSGAPSWKFQDNVGRCGFLSGPESVNNLQFGTCSAGGAIDIFTGNTSHAFGIDTNQLATFDKTVKSYNGSTTAGQGIVPVSCVTSQRTESALDNNLLTCAIPAVAGSYRVRFVLSLSAANAATLGWTATWTDSNAAAQAPTNLALINDTIAGANGSATPALTFTTSSVSDYHGNIDIDVNNAGTSIVVKLTFSGTSFTGKATATVERII